MRRNRTKVTRKTLKTLSDPKYGSNVGSCNSNQIFILNQTQRTPSWIENVSHYFSEYCLTSGVHGVRYLGERGRFLVEKYWLTWSVVVVTMCYFCVTLILSAYNKWAASPVIVTFATTETPIWKTPFPAVTICPVVKSDPEIFNYTDVCAKMFSMNDTTAKEDLYYEIFSLVCDEADLIKNVGIDVFENQSLTINESAIDVLVTAAAAIDFEVHWLGRKYKTESVFSGTYTSEGLCYSFNMLDIEEVLFDAEGYLVNRSIEGIKAEKWSIEDGYPSEAKSDTFPRRTFVTGIHGGLDIYMYTNDSHVDYLCSQFLQGFKVTLHHPSELPHMDQHFRVPLDQAVSVAIKPRMITVSEKVKSYEPKNRECYFANERPLTLFRNYTQRNCLDECLANYTLKECGCVSFYMPKFDETPICGAGSSECIKTSNVKYLSSQTESITTKKGNVVHCHCLPSCISLSYDVEISQNDWNWRAVIDVFTRIGQRDIFVKTVNYEKDHFSRLSVYFGEMQFLTTERHELYGFVEFFSNAGGLLGLFIGFSVTSAIEILYFLTLRIACNIKKYGRAFWAGNGNLKKS